MRQITSNGNIFVVCFFFLTWQNFFFNAHDLVKIANQIKF